MAFPGAVPPVLSIRMLIAPNAVPMFSTIKMNLAAGSFLMILGPPWPKHPCTDRSPLPKEKSKAKPVITLRARGLVQELTAAASAVGLYQGQRIHNGISREWTLIQIQSVARKGFYNFVAARFLETLVEQQTYFSFNSANEMISVGDIVSIRENELSVWDSAKGRPRSYKVEFHSDNQFSSNSKLVAGQN
jgi:hypothetical protein